MTNLPGHGLGVEGVPVHGDARLGGQVVHQGQVARLVHGQVGDAQAEALGQGGFFRDGLKGVHLLPRPVGEGLAHQVPAVGGGVDGHVGGPLFQGALQDGLQGGIGLVVLVEGQVVDEQDKLLPPAGQGADQLGHPGEVFLLHLNEAQVLHAGQIQHGLHCGRLAGAPVAKEEDVVGLPPGQHQPGVLLHLAALVLIAQQVHGAGAVRVGHRDKIAVLPQKGPVFGEQPRPVVPVEPGDPVEVEGGGRPPPGQAGQNGGVLAAQQGLHGVDEPVAVGFGQQDQGVDVPPGGVLQGRVGFALVDEAGVGPLVVPQPVPQPVPQALAAVRAQDVKQSDVGLQGLLAAGPVQGVQKGANVAHDGGVGQLPVGGYAPKGGAQGVQFHSFVSFCGFFHFTG